MQFSTAFVVAVSALLPLVSSHLVLNSPAPYPGTTDNSPLDASGANFPCKFSGNAQRVAPTDTYTPGTAGSFQIQGSAVHGGGSCQISITYDNPPTANSVFKVVQSYEGGCPILDDGNLPANPTNLLPAIPVTLPAGIKAGEAVFAWTWFNRIGNREMYMNCAPITIGGSSTSDDVFNALPNMFVANIGVPESQCTTTEGESILFPDPGKNVIVNSAAPSLVPACGGAATAVPTGSPAQSTAAPPAVTSQPALVGGGDVTTSSVVVGSSFSEIGTPSAVMPAPTQTTFMTVSGTAPVAQPTEAVTTTIQMTSTVMAAPTTPAASAAPTSGSGSGSGSGSFIVGPCDSSKAIIMCGSDLSKYTQCYSDNMAYGPFAVPPGTQCDSTGMGSFKAVAPVSSRHVRRMARQHKRSFFHFHNSH